MWRAGATYMTCEWVDCDRDFVGRRVTQRFELPQRNSALFDRSEIECVVVANADVTFPVAAAACRALIESIGAFVESRDLVVARKFAAGWTNAPVSYTPAKQESLTLTTTFAAQNPTRVYDLYIYDSTDDATTNYDRVLLTPDTAAKEIAQFFSGNEIVG